MKLTPFMILTPFLFVVLASRVPSQVTSTNGGAPSPLFSTPTTYNDYYQRHLRQSRATAYSSRNYTIDKYYYHNPTVSPYLNLTRQSSSYTNNYYDLVRPELERRQSYAPQVTRSSSAVSPALSTPPARTDITKTNPYYQRYYDR